MTPAVLQPLENNHMLVMNVPLNITKYYQPLELTVNGYVKHFMERKIDD